MKHVVVPIYQSLNELRVGQMTTPKFLDNDVYNVKDRESQKRPNEIFVGFDIYGKYSVRVRNISNIAYPVHYTRSDLYEAAQARIKALETALNEAANDIDKFGEKEPIDIPTCQESFKAANKYRAIAGGKDETSNP